MADSMMPDQRSLTDQLHELRVIANKKGMYDAADWIETFLRIAEMREGAVNLTPDTAVSDSPSAPSDQSIRG